MIQYILCDVEGTTTDIQFVHKELFPFAYQNLASFFETHPEEQKKSAGHFSIQPQQLIAHLKSLIENDIKDKELKRIQGLIWQQGYQKQALQGHVYPDVKPAFERWTNRGLTIGIYSSGSVQAQKLIYGHSIAGDLRSYLCDHFDLAVGYKYEPESYQVIATALAIPAHTKMICRPQLPARHEMSGFNLI